MEDINKQETLCEVKSELKAFLEDRANVSGVIVAYKTRQHFSSPLKKELLYLTHMYLVWISSPLFSLFSGDFAAVANPWLRNWAAVGGLYVAFCTNCIGSMYRF